MIAYLRESKIKTKPKSHLQCNRETVSNSKTNANVVYVCGKLKALPWDYHLEWQEQR